MSADSDIVSLRITLRYKDLDEFAAKYAENVSSAGLFLRTKAPKPTGTKIRFELLLADGTRALRGEGVVVTVREDDKPGMALRFNLLDAESQALIDKVVEAHGQGPLAPTPLSTRFGRTAGAEPPARSRSSAPGWRATRPGQAVWGPVSTPAGRSASVPGSPLGRRPSLPLGTPEPGSTVPDPPKGPSEGVPRTGEIDLRTGMPRRRSAIARPWAQPGGPSPSALGETTDRIRIRDPNARMESRDTDETVTQRVDVSSFQRPRINDTIVEPARSPLEEEPRQGARLAVWDEAMAAVRAEEERAVEARAAEARAAEEARRAEEAREQARLAEERRARERAEQERLAEEARAAEERRAEEARLEAEQRAEEERRAEERRAEEERREEARLAEKRRAEEERREAEERREEARLAEERRAEEARLDEERRAEEERREAEREAEERREEARLADERRAEEARRDEERRAEEERREAEERREEARLADERRAEEVRLDEERRAEEERREAEREAEERREEARLADERRAEEARLDEERRAEEERREAEERREEARLDEERRAEEERREAHREAEERREEARLDDQRRAEEARLDEERRAEEERREAHREADERREEARPLDDQRRAEEERREAHREADERREEARLDEERRAEEERREAHREAEERREEARLDDQRRAEEARLDEERRAEEERREAEERGEEARLADERRAEEARLDEERRAEEERREAEEHREEARLAEERRAEGTRRDEERRAEEERREAERKAEERREEARLADERRAEETRLDEERRAEEERREADREAEEHREEARLTDERRAERRDEEARRTTEAESRADHAQVAAPDGDAARTEALAGDARTEDVEVTGDAVAGDTLRIAGDRADEVDTADTGKPDDMPTEDVGDGVRTEDVRSADVTYEDDASAGTESPWSADSPHAPRTGGSAAELPAAEGSFASAGSDQLVTAAPAVSSDDELSAAFDAGRARRDAAGESAERDQRVVAKAIEDHDAVVPPAGGDTWEENGSLQSAVWAEELGIPPSMPPQAARTGKPEPAKPATSAIPTSAMSETPARAEADETHRIDTRRELAEVPLEALAHARDSGSEAATEVVQPLDAIQEPARPAVEPRPRETAPRAASPRAAAPRAASPARPAAIDGPAQPIPGERPADSTRVSVTGVGSTASRTGSEPDAPVSARPPPRSGPFRPVVERDHTAALHDPAEPRPGTSDFSEEVTEFPPEPPGAAATASPRTKLARDESIGPTTQDLASKGRVVGIDFGGRWVRLGTLDASSGELRPITSGGSAFIPALVAVRSDGTLAVGTKARSIFLDDPTRAVAPRTVLRAMKSGGIDPASRLGNVKVENGRVFVNLGVRSIDLHEILVAFFGMLRSVIVAQLGDDPLRAVVSIPSDLDPEARTLLKDAAKEAKLQIAKLFSEPEALIRAYNIDEQPVDTMLMVDVGATHVGLAVARRGRDGFAVAGTRWVEELSASALDARVVDLTLNELATQANEDHRADLGARIRLLEAVERARLDIRKGQVVELKVSLPAPGGASNVGVERSIKLSRGRIYQVTEDAVRQILLEAQALLREVGVHPRALGAVVLAGSAGLYPPLVQGLASLTQKEPLVSVPPAQVFALGLARCGAMLERAEIARRPDCLSMSIGIELPGGRFRPLIKGGEQLPVRLKRKHATTRDNQTEVELELYQGDGELVRGCTHLGKIVLHGVPKGARGAVQIDLTIEVDMDEVATVTLAHGDAQRTQAIFATKHTPEARRSAVAAQRAALEATAEREKPAPKKGLLSRLLGR